MIQRLLKSKTLFGSQSSYFKNVKKVSSFLRIRIFFRKEKGNIFNSLPVTEKRGSDIHITHYFRCFIQYVKSI